MNYTFSHRVQSLKPSAIREILKNSSAPGVIPLSAGNPAPDAFPYEAIGAISQRLLQDTPIAALQYSVTEGYAPLREHLRAYMAQKHQVGTEKDEVLITSGAQQVMDLLTKTLLNEGDTVLCGDWSSDVCSSDLAPSIPSGPTGPSSGASPWSRTA